MVGEGEFDGEREAGDGPEEQVAAFERNQLTDEQQLPRLAIASTVLTEKGKLLWVDAVWNNSMMGAVQPIGAALELGLRPG